MVSYIRIGWNVASSSSSLSSSGGGGGRARSRSWLTERSLKISRAVIHRSRSGYISPIPRPGSYWLEVTYLSLFFFHSRLHGVRFPQRACYGTGLPRFQPHLSHSLFPILLLWAVYTFFYPPIRFSLALTTWFWIVMRLDHRTYKQTHTLESF